MNFKIYGPYLSPDDASGNGGNEGLSEDAQDLADLEGEPEGEEDDPDGDEEGGEGDPDGEEEGDGDGSEGDQEGDGEEDEEAEGEEGAGKGRKKDDDEPEVDASGRPTVKAVKAAFPDIFKKFPYLKTAFFELPRYKEVFADPEEAQSAATKAGDFDALESSLVGKGDPSILLNVLNENNPKALARVVENFGPALRKLNPEVYLKLTEPIIEDLIYYANAHGTKTGNKNLVLSAKHIAHYVFSNNGEIPDISKRAAADSGPSEDELQLQRDRQEFDNTRHRDALVSVATSASTVLDRVVENKLDGLTPFEKKALVRDCREQTNSALQEDKAFQRSLASLWAQAKRDNYSDASKERIKSAWLSRAKAVAPGIRNKLKQEALAARTDSGEGNRTRNKEKRTFPAQGGRSVRGGGGRVLDPHKIDYSKTSDADILSGDNGRVTFKR